MVLALMRHPEYCVYATTTSGVFDDPQAAESSFHSVALQERSKFSHETLSNSNGVVSTSVAPKTGMRAGSTEVLVLHVVCEQAVLKY
jgi:uncharacterized membrane protein